MEIILYVVFGGFFAFLAYFMVVATVPVVQEYVNPVILFPFWFRKHRHEINTVEDLRKLKVRKNWNGERHSYDDAVRLFSVYQRMQNGEIVDMGMLKLTYDSGLVNCDEQLLKLTLRRKRFGSFGDFVEHVRPFRPWEEARYTRMFETQSKKSRKR